LNEVLAAGSLAMAFSKTLLGLLTVGAVAVSDLAVSSLDLEHEAKPIAKVVSLLESMSNKLEEDQKADEEMKEKLDCWCKQNSKEKLEAAQAAKEKVEGLTALVNQLGPKIEQLGTELRTATKELNQNKATLKTAETIREEQVKAFKEDEASLMTAIDSVAKAKEALNASASGEMQSVYSASLVQQPRMHQLAENLQKVLEGRGALAYSKMSNGDKMILTDFIKKPVQFVKGAGGAFLQKSMGKSREPSSSSIVGILQAMADDFAEDLQKELEEEKANQKSYKELTAAKSQEVKALDEQITAKTQEKAESESTLQVSKEDIKATSKSRKADLKFGAAVEKHCTGSDEKYQERSSTRAAEMQAVSKALEVFQGDENRSLLRKSVSLLQLDTTTISVKKMSSFLLQQGRKLGAEQLVTLGLEGKLDSFTVVKEKIQEMTSVLTKQKADEAAHKEMCVDDLNENALTTEDKDGMKNRTENKIVLLKAKIGGCEQDVSSLRAEIAELGKQIQIAGQTRQKENAKFQTEATEQSQTQMILKKAVQFLRKFYSSASLVQIRRHGDEPAALGNPEGFQDYQKNAGGQGVIALIETIAEDAHKLEMEAIQDEQDSQASYEDFTAQTSATIKAKQSEVDGKMKEMAEAKNDKAEAESSRESTLSELDELFEAKMALHKECDFFVTNFQVRQKALGDEIEALGQAAAILAGAK